MLNKTLNGAAKKTKSVPKRARIVLFIVLTLVFLVAFIALYTREANAPDPATDISCLKTKGDSCAYNLEIASTNSQRIRGLSERDSLKKDGGMLFVFDRPGEQCFWMKDTRLNLDIIWLDGQKQITKLMKNVSPDTYPESFCQDNTKYVIELNGSEAENSGYNVGDQLIFTASL